MKTELNLELLGADRLTARLSRASERLDRNMVEGLNEAADQIVQDAKAVVPVDTGSLQRSIRKQHHVSEGHVHSIGVTAGGYVTNFKTGRKVDYAVHVEYGTSRVAAKPFLRPALERNRPLLRGVLKDRVEESLRE